MGMRVKQNRKTTEQLKKEYETNIQGYIFMAKENNNNILISENNDIIVCKAQDFWNTIRISVMDIEIENPKFIRCEYINDKLMLEYDDRIIKLKMLNDGHNAIE
jgi:hypothetical protein